MVHSLVHKNSLELTVGDGVWESLPVDRRANRILLRGEHVAAKQAVDAGKRALPPFKDRNFDTNTIGEQAFRKSFL